MARRPFFSGNYGSALGSYDTAARLLAGAGQAQGQMFANLGANIGGAIEKYQLNKEKRDEAQRSLEANIGYMAQNDPETLAKFKQEYAKDFAALEKDGRNAKTISNLNAGMAVWKDRLTADLNRNLKESQARNLESENRMKTLQNKLTERTQDFDVENKKLANKLLALKTAGFTKEQEAALKNLDARTAGTQATTAKTIAETKGIPEAQEANLNLKRKELEILKERLLRMPKDAKNQDALAEVNLALKNLDLRFKPGQLQREQTMGQLGITEKGLQVSALSGKLDREKREGEGRILAQSIDTAKAAADLARDAEKYDVYSPSERAAAEKEKDHLAAEETKARTDTLLSELAALMEANEPIDDSMLVGIENAAILPIDIETAAGGDGVGWLTDAANWIAGVAPIGGGTGWSPDRIRERTNLANFQGMVVPAFLRGISTHGGKWAREDIMKMIPQEDDTNAEMRSKITQLIPHMRRKVVEAKLIYKQGTSNASIRNTALQIRLQFPGLIKMLNQSIGGGGEIEEAEEILREGQ